MDHQALRDQLTRLHRELGAARSVDPQSRQLLVEIMHDITRLTEAPDGATGANPPAAAKPGAAGLPDRLEGVAVQFEADHPALAASVRRFVDLLGKAGL
jgi:hypothetical protein